MRAFARRCDAANISQLGCGGAESRGAADALNQLFGVTVFTVNFPIGTATVKINNSRFE